MSRYRLCPTWNLAVEQHAHWRPGRRSGPGFAEQCRRLTQARAEFAWLRGGSIVVQQQALKDFAQAMANFFGNTHRKPTWRKRGQGEGFRIVAVKAGDVRRLSRHVGDVKVPKVGWVRFRWSRPVPEGVKLKARETDRRKDWVEKTSTDLARRFDVIAVEDLKVGDMTRSAKGTLEAPGRNVRQKAGLNRGIPAAGWGLLEHKACGRVRKIDPRGTSQTCNACKHTAREGRESQALRDNIKDTAVGHTVAARGGTPSGGPANREPQRDLLLVG